MNLLALSSWGNYGKVFCAHVRALSFAVREPNLSALLWELLAENVRGLRPLSRLEKPHSSSHKEQRVKHQGN